MSQKITIASNASCNDLYRMRYIIPHWLRSFSKDVVDEILIVFDRQPASGRIAAIHKFGFREEQIDAELAKLVEMDDRVRVVDLDYTQVDAVGLKWFGLPGLNRCQGGTPIFPFFFAVEQAKNAIVIKLDSDMIFHNKRIEQAVLQAFETDSKLSFISLPRFANAPEGFSTRAFALNLDALTDLPLSFIQFDPLRSLHRRLTKRVPYRAPETAIQVNIDQGVVKHHAMDLSSGCSLHVTLGWWPGLLGFSEWLASVEAGVFPERQDNWDFVVSAWESAL
jgi:hypothetical protein